MGSVATDRPGARARVLHVITHARVGGAQNYVAWLLPALTEEFDVAVAAQGPGPLEEAAESAGAEFISLRWMRREIGWRDLAALVELVFVIHRFRPDLVHATSSKAGVLGRLAAAIARVPVRIFTVQGWSFVPYSGWRAAGARWLERVMRPLTSVVICPSESTKVEGLQARCCTPEQAAVIPNAIDVGERPPRQPDPDVPQLISVGRLQPQKDWSTFVRGLRLLEPGTYRASIVGDGPDRSRVEGEIDQLGLAADIELLGNRDDVGRLLESADVFVLSSHWEVLPLAILEAMAAALPVVATAVGGVRELVLDGRTGFVIPPGDPEALARAVGSLVEDAGRRRRMGEAGRARVEEHFDLRQAQRAHAHLYRKALAGQTSRRMLRRPMGRPSASSRLARALKERGVAGTLRVAARWAGLRVRRLQAALEERRFDRRLSVDTRGILYHDRPDEELHGAVGPYQGVRERRFATALTSLDIDLGGFTFIDLGCGKGKALLLAAEAGFPKIVGVEFEPALCDLARANLDRYAGMSARPVEFEVATQDAREFRFPPDPTVLFLYNPFQQEIMSAVVDNLERSLQEHPRELYVMYLNPRQAAPLDASPFLSRMREGRDYLTYGHSAA
jgi:glycosyltransferase involved in cell wall biosynthesis